MFTTQSDHFNSFQHSTSITVPYSCLLSVPQLSMPTVEMIYFVNQLKLMLVTLNNWKNNVHKFIRPIFISHNCMYLNSHISVTIKVF